MVDFFFVSEQANGVYRCDPSSDLAFRRSAVKECGKYAESERVLCMTKCLGMHCELVDSNLNGSDPSVPHTVNTPPPGDCLYYNLLGQDVSDANNFEVFVLRQPEP